MGQYKVAVLLIEIRNSHPGQGLALPSSVCPLCPPLPESLICLVRPEDQQDGKKPAYELVGPSWNHEEVRNLPLLGRNVEDEHQISAPYRDKAKSLGDSGEDTRGAS